MWAVVMSFPGTVSVAGQAVLKLSPWAAGGFRRRGREAEHGSSLGRPPGLTQSLAACPLLRGSSRGPCHGEAGWRVVWACSLQLPAPLVWASPRVEHAACCGDVTEPATATPCPGRLPPQRKPLGPHGPQAALCRECPLWILGDHVGSAWLLGLGLRGPSA